MALNSGLLNDYGLNEASAFSAIGSGLIISIEQNVQETEGPGALISIEQNVSYIGSGEEISIEQDVELRITGSGQLVSFEQEIKSTQSGEIITIEQSVISPSQSTHLNNNGWMATVVVGGYEIPSSQIHGAIEIERGEGTASSLVVTLIPGTGAQDLDFYRGKAITCDVATSDGNFRIFTGTVDIPEINIIEKKITLVCTDRRTERINAQLPGFVGTIGYYSTYIFEDSDSAAEELEFRLTTIPYSLDFDAYGNYNFTAWAAKAVADYTLDDSVVYYSEPKVELTSRSNITNKEIITFQYRYNRLHQTERTFTWTAPFYNSFCTFASWSASMTFRDMIRGAITSAGWPLKTDVTFTPIFNTGWYSCVGGWVLWSTTAVSGYTTIVKDKDGNAVRDAQGNVVTEGHITGGTDFSNLYCLGATWVASTRWAQTATEEYTLTVQAPQSQAQFGNVEKLRFYAQQDDVDVADWENYTSYSNVGGGGTTYYINKDVDRNGFNYAVITALNISKTAILESHRDTKVYIQRNIWPQVDLRHTVAIDTTTLQAKGKVFKINHKLDVNSGEDITSLTLILSKSTGSASDSTLSLPTAPTDTITLDTGTITLGNHYGEDPTTEAAAQWNGYIGNRIPDGQFDRTSYQEQFIVDVPEIPQYVRQEKVLTSSQTYNVEIPNDTLTVVF